MPKLAINNSSGVTGVYYYKRDGNWLARLDIKGKIHSKTCSTKEEAVIARKRFEDLYRV